MRPEAAKFAPDVVYLDTYKLFSDANGDYSRDLPDENGNDAGRCASPTACTSATTAPSTSPTSSGQLLDKRWQITAQADPSQPIDWTIAPGQRRLRAGRRPLPTDGAVATRTRRPRRTRRPSDGTSTHGSERTVDRPPQPVVDDDEAAVDHDQPQSTTTDDPRRTTIDATEADARPRIDRGALSLGERRSVAWRAMSDELRAAAAAVDLAGAVVDDRSRATWPSARP